VSCGKKKTLQDSMARWARAKETMGASTRAGRRFFRMSISRTYVSGDMQADLPARNRISTVRQEDEFRGSQLEVELGKGSIVLRPAQQTEPAAAALAATC
jgi:hypothetical protein